MNIFKNICKEFKRFVNSNVVSPRAINVVFKKICFAIQKGVAAQLVACLPSIYM
jgi:hypothetical protein